MAIQRKPDIDDEAIGMKAFHLRKERSAERAIEKIRQSLGTDWAKLSIAEINLLSWVLGETWAYAARAKWDKIPFSAAKLKDVMQINNIGTDIINHQKSGTEGLHEIYQLLQTF